MHKHLAARRLGGAGDDVIRAAEDVCERLRHGVDVVGALDAVSQGAAEADGG